MCVTTDGGLDHNCRHLAIEMAMLGVFLKTGMDMLGVSRVAPTQSWTNPTERCMGPLKFALYNCALDRIKLRDHAMEAYMRLCNGMASVRLKAHEFALAASTLGVGNLQYVLDDAHISRIYGPDMKPGYKPR